MKSIARIARILGNHNRILSIVSELVNEYQGNFGIIPSRKV